MKSSQFTELFQEHIYNVFYDPKKIKNGNQLREKWKELTNSLLKDVLPQKYANVSNKIEEQFFTDEVEYHFEHHSVEYDISIDTEGIATIVAKTLSNIVLAPHINNPILKQSVETDGEVKLLGLTLNSIAIENKDELYVVDEKNSRKRTLMIELNKFLPNDNTTLSDKVIKYERYVEYIQDLKIEPYIMGQLSRYVKGLEVKAKVSGDYIIHFETLGLDDLFDDQINQDNGIGFKCWQLAKPDTTLLPGKGYILMLAKNNVQGA